MMGVEGEILLHQRGEKVRVPVSHGDDVASYHVGSRRVFLSPQSFIRTLTYFKFHLLYSYRIVLYGTTTQNCQKYESGKITAEELDILTLDCSTIAITGRRHDWIPCET